MILEPAVGPSKKVQDFESESFAMGVDHSLLVKATPIASDNGSKDCAFFPDPTAGSRIIFTKQKFLSLPKERQHKKLCLLLKEAYIEKIGGKNPADLLDLYQKYADWIGFEIPPLTTLKEISDAFHTHARLASYALRENSLLPRLSTLDASKKQVKLPFYVYLDNLRSAFNVGSIIRTAECFGFSKVYFAKDTPTHFSTKVQKSAMGTHEWIECIENPSLDNLPRPLIVLETVEEAPSLFDFTFPPSFTLILGNEEYGVSDALLKEADLFVRIPLLGKKGSLNVANAFAIAAAFAAKSASGSNAPLV